jgi:hypothetical protein
MSLEDLLPEDFEDREKVIGQFKDVPSLVNSYRELRKSMDSSVRVPTPEASIEERSAFFQRLGAPESADEYEIEEGTEEWATKAREAAHKAHLTKDQWKTLAEAQRDLIASQRSEWEEKLTTSQEKSRSTYGDRYDEVVDRAKTALETLASKNEKLAETLGQVDLRDSGALELFNMVGEMMTDGSAPADGGTAETNEHGDDIELAMNIRELMKHKAFQNRREAEHEKVQHEYRQKLQELINRGYQSVFDPRLKNNPY